MDKRLLDVLVCPVTGAAVRPLKETELEPLNERIRSGEARYADGSAIGDPLTSGLITVDGRTVYRVDDDIPVMLPERGIPRD